MVSHPGAGRRNAAVLAATAATVGVLFLFPTSLHAASHGSPQDGAVAEAPVAPGTVTDALDTGTASAGSSSGSAASSTGSSSSSSTSSASATAKSGATSTVTGTAAYTRFGPVQVQIKVKGGTIVAATAVTYPQSNGRDRAINSYAVPVLEQATLDAQSAQVDTVSGATFTSLGYIQSLQAALDAAHLG